MLDKNGYRLNVGIVIANSSGKLFWGKRLKSGGWQFPQGGVDPYETLEESMFRELYEEVGLGVEDVEVLGITRRWLHYKLPVHMRRDTQRGVCVGQKQKWFLLFLTGGDDRINVKTSSKPEFAGWRWVKYWEPLKQVVYFKRDVYSKVLSEFQPIVKSKIKLDHSGAAWTDVTKN